MNFCRKFDISPCPYGKKCTYGNKCKFSHPERGSGHKSVTERLSEHAARHLSARNSVVDAAPQKVPVQGKSLSVPLSSPGNKNVIGQEQFLYGNRKQLCRSGKMASNMYATPEIPKSHSIENISPYSQQQQLQQLGHSYSRLSSANEDTEEAVNLHKKLHRQLTLNPIDPRTIQLQQRGIPLSSSSSPSPSNTADMGNQYHGRYNNYLPHRSLGMSLSSGPNMNYGRQAWENDSLHPVSFIYCIVKLCFFLNI